MQYPFLITSDIHLVASSSTEYRWGLFPWLAQQIKTHKVKTLLILGDITDAKDNHSAELTNRVVQSINSLPINDIRIMAGNHDWLKKGQEFFRFLNLIPAVEFITQPTGDEDHEAFFLPYSKDPAGEWPDLIGRMAGHQYIFMHQTLKGARASNGQIMDGENVPDLAAQFPKARIFSGDIHVPQNLAGITYVGSPYHVHFGDSFKPRCILVSKTGEEVDLHFNTLSRVVLDVSGLADLKRKNLREGDQVKVRVALSESDKHDWSRIRRAIQAELVARRVAIHGVELNLVKSNRRLLVGDKASTVRLTPQESILRFVEHEELGASSFDAAMDILETK